MQYVTIRFMHWPSGHVDFGSASPLARLPFYAVPHQLQFNLSISSLNSVFCCRGFIERMSASAVNIRARRQAVAVRSSVTLL